ncbi:type II toxin-antitoxin system YoeB family toxin [Prevotella multiformis]|uniref:Putative mRNA interferase YoeB n=1 Tax=Prevotella multiformis DSM 16608 TaxID=888743 RepID=F0F9L3_9BACT|nr:type II toxin-antitoxin system YoeB family toxin [Prevotella multiformis]EGC19172.1 addiction module toxin, Txe/YoeB family [Prevotella multiformis DSM 16608]
MYELDFTVQSQKEIAKLRKSDIQAYKKLKLLLAELREHPYTGTGHPHQLRYIDGIWSRELDKKNRIRYMVNDTTIVVLVLSALGHYDDK